MALSISRYASNILRKRILALRPFCSVSSGGDNKDTTPTSENESDQNVKGLAQALKKLDSISIEQITKQTEVNIPKNEPIPEPSFASLLRQSNFMELGDFKGRHVVGKIFHIANDDLYIDFGGKFHCVCKRPRRNPTAYVRGAKVRLEINDLELSSRFLGAEKDVTLMEADATLLGIIWSPVKFERRSSNKEAAPTEEVAAEAQ